MPVMNLTRPPPPPPEPSFPPRPPPPPPPPMINALTFVELLATVKVPLLVNVCIVLLPLVDLDPFFRDPETQLTIKDLLNSLKDHYVIKRLSYSNLF